MGKLINLLRWKKRLALLDYMGESVKDEKGKPVVVWLRIIGDEDQQSAYKLARIKSYEVRMKLRDENSSDYKDAILPIEHTTKEIAIELVKAARGSTFTSEALVNVERPEIPKMDEVAVDADAPTLEEQEKLDRLLTELDENYQKEIKEYIETKQRELDAQLESMDLDALRREAMAETANAMAMSAFLIEVQEEKIWRAIYQDEDCRHRAVDSVEEFRALHSVIKKQLTDAYNDLEMSPEEIKN